MNYRKIDWDEDVRAAVDATRARAGWECETPEDFAQAEADRDTLLAVLWCPA